MACLLFIAQPAAITTGTVVKTLLQLLAPTNQCGRIVEWSISFDGTSNTGTPILVEILRQTSAGVGGTALTLRKVDNGRQETIQFTAITGPTTEPTDGSAILFIEKVHPQTGYSWQASYGREIIIAGAERLGLRVTAAAAVNASLRMMCEE